jgi:hypothetical protein
MKRPFFRQFATDWPVLSLAVIVVCLYSYYGFPVTVKGFTCRDKALMYPYMDSTVSSGTMYSVSVVVPVVVVLLVELVIKRECVECYDKVLRFGFGSAFTQVSLFRRLTGW